MSLIGYGVDLDSAEQGVLAELMWKPDRIAEVKDWLEPDDFSGNLHRQMYRAITSMEPREVSPMAVAQRLWDQADAYVDGRSQAALRPTWAHGQAEDLFDRQQRVRMERLRADFIARAASGLIEVLDNSRPGNPAVYGRVVLEASVQRRLEVYGETVQQIGRNGLGETPDLMDHASVRLDQLQEELSGLRERWDRSSEAIDSQEPSRVMPMPGDDRFDASFNAGW